MCGSHRAKVCDFFNKKDLCSLHLPAVALADAAKWQHYHRTQAHSLTSWSGHSCRCRKFCVSVALRVEKRVRLQLEAPLSHSYTKITGVEDHKLYNFMVASTSTSTLSMSWSTSCSWWITLLTDMCIHMYVYVCKVYTLPHALWLLQPYALCSIFASLCAPVLGAICNHITAFTTACVYCYLFASYNRLVILGSTQQSLIISSTTMKLWNFIGF